MASILAPFRGTVLHYAVAYLDAVVLGATRDMLDRQVRVSPRNKHAYAPWSLRAGVVCGEDRRRG